MSFQTWSRPLDVHRVSDFPGVNDIAEGLTEEIVDLRRSQGRGVRERKELFEHVRIIVLDLFVASHERAPAERRPVPRWLGVKLGKEAFAKKESRYSKLFLSYRRTSDAIYALRELRYIRLVPGFYDRRTGIGRVTRIRARRKLLDHFEARKVPAEAIGTIYTGELIVLRDADGNDIDFEDTAQTNEWRANLERINAAIAKLRIRLKVTDEELFALNRRMVADSERGAIDYGRTSLRRVFNYSSWNQGGRFYGGWWQGIPREYRRYLDINHKHAVEVDYSGHHIRMLYALEGLDAPDDPYDVEGIARDLQKECILIMINAPAEESAHRAMRREIPKPTRLDTVVGPILKRHEPIAKYLYSKVGLELQFRDSVVAEKVMLRMLDRGRPVLPMHDSFIMRAGLVEELEDEMNRAFEEEFPNTKAKIKLKETSYDMEQKEKHNKGEEVHYVTDDIEELFKDRKKYSKFYE